jgi:CheY-like chemotaxis protein
MVRCRGLILNSTEVTKRSFLLVEDEALIRMMLADMIEDLGHRVVGESGNLDEALILARKAEFDIAILDLNLAGVSSLPVAEVIAERGIPFFFASGYSEAGVPETFKGISLLRKPFQLENLDRAIRSLLAS